MTWPILAAISIFSVSIASVIQKVLMTNKKSDSITYSIVFQFLLGVIFTVYVLFVGFKMPPLAKYPFNYFVSTLFWGLATFLSFQALKYISASLFLIVGSFSTLVTMVASAIFLNEQIFGRYIIGAILILLSVYIVSRLNSDKSENKNQTKGVLLTLLMALCGGLAVTNDVFLLRTADTASYLAVMTYLPGVVLLLLAPKSIKKLATFAQPAVLGNMLIFSLFYAGQAITYYMAVNAGANLSQMAPISKASIVIAVILEVIFLRNTKNIPAKLLATVLLMLGILFLR
jgi:drug/metabolite transporter (DMT)-like permease